MNKSIRNNWLLLIFSLVCIYLLSPDLDRRHGPLVSLCFALIFILNSRISGQPNFVLRYFLFIIIDQLTYFILFNDQPWDYLFHAGLYASSPVPLIVCSLIMSLAGGLLLNNWKDRVKYFLVTSGVQIPIACFAASGLAVDLLNRLANSTGFDQDYAGVWQAWQLEWMLTYYLALYVFSLRPDMRLRKDH